MLIVKKFWRISSSLLMIHKFPWANFFVKTLEQAVRASFNTFSLAKIARILIKKYKQICFPLKSISKVE